MYKLLKCLIYLYIIYMFKYLYIFACAYVYVIPILKAVTRLLYLP